MNAKLTKALEDARAALEKAHETRRHLAECVADAVLEVIPARSANQARVLFGEDGEDLAAFLPDYAEAVSIHATRSERFLRVTQMVAAEEARETQCAEVLPDLARYLGDHAWADEQERRFNEATDGNVSFLEVLLARADAAMKGGAK